MLGQVLPDELSQYLRLRHDCARCSVQDTGTEKDKKGKSKFSSFFSGPPAASITANCARVYFPGQIVDAKVSVDEHLMETLGDLVFEFEGTVS